MRSPFTRRLPVITPSRTPQTIAGWNPLGLMRLCFWIRRAQVQESLGKPA